jgi:hypothetical protein
MSIESFPFAVPARDPPGASRRRLWRAWAVLAGLTVASMVAGLIGGKTTTAALDWPLVAFVLAVTWTKARQILMVYLNLAAAPAAWRGGLGALVLLILALVLAGHLALALS